MKQWKGVIIEESLLSKEVIKDVKIVNTRTTKVKDAIANQPKIWHLHEIIVDDEIINSVCEKIKKTLKTCSWYVDFGTDEEEIVIFKNKIFRAKKDDKEEIRKIKEYGKSVGIPERQLDFDRNW